MLLVVGAGVNDVTAEGQLGLLAKFPFDLIVFNAPLVSRVIVLTGLLMRLENIFMRRCILGPPRQRLLFSPDFITLMTSLERWRGYVLLYGGFFERYRYNKLVLSQYGIQEVAIRVSAKPIKLSLGTALMT
jgi:hypothetical protein